MATEGCSSSTSVENSSEKQEIMKKANELLAQGKRNVVCGEVPKAIALYDEAVQMLAKEYGELSRYCVEAYFSYGSALLELGRMETNVLGVALEGVDVDAKEDEADSEQFEKPPAEDGEEREKLRSEVYEAMAEGEREKQIDGKEDADDKKDGKEESGETMDTDDKAGTSELDVEKKCLQKELEGTDTEKSSEKDKATDKPEPAIDDGNGRSDEDQPMQENKSKSEEIRMPKQDEVESKPKTEGNESKVDCKENDNKKEQNSDTQKDKEKESKEHESTKENKIGEKSEQAANEKELKMEESPVKILAEVNQQKGEEKQKEANKTSAEEKENISSDKVSSEIIDKEEKAVKDSEMETEKGEKEANSEIEKEKENTKTEANMDMDKGKDEKEKTKTDFEKETEKDDKDKTDTDVEMTENNDKEEEEEDDADEAPEKEEEQEQEEEGDEQEGAESQEDEKDEDVPNFQLAWEYLELAKVIYLKSDNKEDQLKAAECHIKLGEVSMETEQHSIAAEDLESALKIQQKYLAPEDRVIAETHYQLGLAYGLGKEFEQSIQHYQKAISVIEAKIASLSKLVEENEKDPENKENKEVDELQKYKDEIKELQELIPEMNNKIDDTKTEAKDMEKMKEVARQMLGLSGTTKGFGSPTKKSEVASGSGGDNVDENGEKKASDISSLIRKKRKPDEEISAESTAEVKKIKQDDGAVVTTNGVTEKEANKEVENKDTEDVKMNGSEEIKANGDATDTEMVSAS